MRKLFKIIRFVSIIYLVMEKNLLDLVAKVEFMKMGSPQELAQCVSWFTETKSDMQAQ